jgi:tetratricopeptide (TPR) repeat protein
MQNRIAGLVFSLLLITVSAFAQTPANELSQMVAQLQKTPTDNALREKIIKFVQTLNPVPSIPEEAERRMARGAAAFKSATLVADYQAAAKEFDQATLAAPWYGDAYFNLGLTQDKAVDYEAALRSLKLAQLASPDNKETKALIYEVEYRQEKANSAEARAAKEKEAERRFITSLEGAKFDCHETRDEYTAERWQIEINQGKIHGFNIVTWSRLPNRPVGRRGPWFNGQVQGRITQWKDEFGGVDTRVEIYDNRLVVNQNLNPPFAVTCRHR